MITNNTSSLIAINAQQTAKAVSADTQVAALGKSRKMNDAKIDATAKDFESMFLAQMIGQMFGESTGSEMFGGEDTKDIYKNMMVEEYGKKIAQSGGIGIASFVKRELLAMQEVAK